MPPATPTDPSAAEIPLDDTTPLPDIPTFDDLLRRFKRSMPHNAIFKAVFAAPEETAPIVQSVLSETARSAYDWEHMRNEPTETLGPDMNELRADLLFSLPLRDSPERRDYCYILEGGQSTFEKFYPLRLLSYFVGIWTRERNAHPDRPLPRIIPLVIYNGTAPWRAPANFEHLLAPLPSGAGELLRFTPKFDFNLLDLTQLRPGQIPGTLTGRMILDLMAFVRRKQKGEHTGLLNDIRDFFLRHSDFWACLNASDPRSQQLVQILFLYLATEQDSLTLPEIKQIVSELPILEDNIMTSLAEAIHNGGVAEGELRGELRGKQCGELVGRILAIQEIYLGRTTPARELFAKTTDELQGILAQLRASHAASR